MNSMRVLPVLLCVSWCAAAFAAEVTVRVAPDGPINSLAAARDEVRRLRGTRLAAPIRVQFETGVYRQDEAVVFLPEDSGSATAPITYEAAPGAKAVITGGRQITGWQPADQGLWKTSLPDVAAEEWYFEQLWVNGRRATRARSPNKGFFNMYSQAGGDVFPGMKEPNFHAFVVRPAEMKLLESIPRNELPDVLLTAVQTWTVGQCRIEALNEATRAVKIKGRARYPFVEFEPDQRFFIENYRESLDAPGEWFLARDGTLFYKPLPGEDMTKAEVIAPVAEKFMILQGDWADSKPVSHLTFRGLVFSHSQQLYGPSGHHDGQAASGVGAAVELDGAEHVSFENCEIAHCGNYAVWFRRGCSDCSLRHSHLHDLGAGGVRIGDTSMPRSDSELTHDITVDDCIIHGGGRMFPSACGVFLAHAADCAVTHNDIADLFYTGISAGWVWGYHHSPSKRNRFDFNHIHHLGFGYLSDMGGFYGLGRAEGTTISHNYVHHVASYRYGGWGLYTDEGSTGVTMENNLVHDTSESTFHQHYGKWNLVANNIFAFGRKAQIQRSRPEKHASFCYERNIVFFDQAKLLDGSWYNWEPGTLEMRQNVYWKADGSPPKFLDTDLPGWQKKTGRDEGSLVADPLFVDAAKRDFRLKANSPALKLGFKPFDHTVAGVRGGADSEWRKLALGLSFPDWETETLPWPKPEFSVDTDFETMGLSFPTMPRQEIQWENRGDSILVCEEQAASGKRSLKFTDARGLERVWNPHLILKPGFKDGAKVFARFALRVEPGARVDHEWRTEGHPYFVGPSFSIRDGKLQIRNGPALEVPVSQWLKIEIDAQVGKSEWSMRVAAPGLPPKAFDRLACQKEWLDFGWMGWTSVASEKAVFYLDDLKVGRVP